MTLYYDAFRNGLVPVRVLTHDGQLFTVKVTRTRGAYKAGDVFDTSGTWLVHKTRVKCGIQYVRQAQL